MTSPTPTTEARLMSDETRVDVLDVMASDAYDARMYRRQITSRGTDDLAESEDAYVAVAELIEASSEYFNKYLQDEADDDTGGWTGIHHEQYLAANRLKNALARIGAKP